VGADAASGKIPSDEPVVPVVPVEPVPLVGELELETDPPG
jgi:hypothetical protein